MYVYIYIYIYIYIAQKVCTAYSRTSYKIISLTNLNKYLNTDINKTNEYKYEYKYKYKCK